MTRYWFSRKYEINFLGIPKTGVTSICAMLDIDIDKDWGKSPVKNYNTFTVLREPIDRAVSAYYETLRRGTLSRGATIDDYITKINHCGFFDNHCEPMVNYFKDCEYVLIFEKGLTNQLNKLIPVNLVRHAENVTPQDKKIILNNEQRIRLEKIYARDIELYNYFLSNP